MELKKLEKKLKKLQEKYIEEEFKEIRGFKNYFVSNFGRVKVIDHSIVKKVPKGNVEGTYVYKGKMMKPLFVGPSRKWKHIRLTTEKNTWKQVSIVKLMISTFMKIDLCDLPHSIYFKDGDPLNICLNNLTFFMLKRKI